MTGPDGPGPVPPRPPGDDDRERLDAELLEVVYEIAVSALDQVISLSQGEFLA